MKFWFVLWIIATVESFSISSPRRQPYQQQHSIYRKKNAFRLYMTSSNTKLPNFSSTDPFHILGIDPTADSQAIKRAYKKLAFQYHPDMVTTKDSTAEEKRKASDQFAKINAAYEALAGKTGRASPGTSTSGSSKDNTKNAWTPPHRRTSSTASSSSTNWRDYIPYTSVEDEKYDAGGDSFGAIFADLFAGASKASASGGVVKDFIEFLEQTVDAYSSSSSSSYSSMNNENDADLQFLLQTGSIRQVGDEMDETELVLQQLNKKMQRMDMDLMQLQADIATSRKFTQKMELEESVDELRARKRVVENYIQKARKRLLALQTRYKQLVVQGENDPKAGGTSRSTRADTSYTSQSPPPPPRASSSSTSSQNNNNSEDSWKEESFGSFGRGRGSSRRRTQRNTSYEESSSTSTSAGSASSSSSYPSSSPNQSSYTAPEPNRSTSASTPASTPGSYDYVPPHRRTQASSAPDDKRRLREIKVDEEFEKLKRDLGL
jgi:curved DNA-binding protein CbpA